MRDGTRFGPRYELVSGRESKRSDVLIQLKVAIENIGVFRFQSDSGRLVPYGLSNWLETFNVLSVGNAVDFL